MLFLLYSIFFISSVASETISEIFGEDFLDDSVYFESGPYGSNNDGTWFTDFRQKLDGSRFEPRHWPDTINLRAGQSIDGVQITYGPYRGIFHGGRDGGYLNKLRLYNGDRIVEVRGRAGVGPGAQVDQLTFVTKNGKIEGPFGGQGGRPFVAQPPPNVISPLNGKKLNCYLAWIAGKADYSRLTAISFYWRCPKYERPAEELVPTSHRRPEWNPWRGGDANGSIRPQYFLPAMIFNLLLIYYLI